MNLVDIKRQFEYMDWANDLAMQAAANLAHENLRRDFGSSHGSIFGTLLHMAGAEWIWVERWHGHSPRKTEAWASWSTEACADVRTLAERWQAVRDRRTRFVCDIDEEQLAADLDFNLLSGDASSMPLVDQMLHVVNHATMHRGQVVGMIRQLGIEPPSTDLIFYLRRSISPK
jgi:uncharacterized damage-inducible protein DinB